MEIGKLYLFTIKGWNEKFYGIVENFSEEWILVRSIISDFLLDGYTVIQKKHLREYIENDDTIFKWRVIDAKGFLSSYIKSNMSIDSVTSPLEWLKQNSMTFILNPREESISYVGKIDNLLKNSFYMKALNSKGIWDLKLYLYRINNIKTINFDTDYVNSLLAYNLKYMIS